MRTPIYKTSLSKAELTKRIKQIRHFALDMDGTIYNGGTLFDYTNPFLHKIKEVGISYSFLTNNPTRNIFDCIKHLKNLGIKADTSEIYTPVLSVIAYLKLKHPQKKKLFILGTPSMIKEFEKAGFISLPDSPEAKPEAVVIGFDTSLTYARLARAAWWISKEVLYLATNPDHVCPTDDQLILPDCGAICAALEVATKRKPDIILGKPNPNMLDRILHQNKLNRNNIAMVGDRIYTDIVMAKKANVLSVLVLSGETKIEDLQYHEHQPDIIVKNLKELGNLITQTLT